MKLDDLPERYKQQVRPQLASQINQPMCGELALPGKPGMLVCSDAVEEESELHEAIRKHCAIKGWLPLHGSMAHKTHRTPGEWDFVILAEHPCLLLVECKDREGKVSADQAAIAAWAKRLGWHPTVCRSITEFLRYVSTYGDTETSGGAQ